MNAPGRLRRSLGLRTPRGLALVGLALALVVGAAGNARASDAERRAIALQLDIERGLLDAALRRASAAVTAERDAAAALERAATDMLTALAPARAAAARAPTDAPARLPPEVAGQRLREASGQLGVASDAARIELARHQDQALRVQALEAALVALMARGRSRPLDGEWDLVFSPGGTGMWTLVQTGTMVAGEYALANGESGSVTGTFAGGRLRLDRVNAALGKDASLDGVVEGDAVHGTWLAAEFGRGRPEAGTWQARRRATPVPAGEASDVGGDGGEAGR